MAARSSGTETLDREAAGDVLAGARAGSPRAWEAIFTEFAPALTRFAASRGVPDPEDITQEVMEAAAARIDRFDGGWDQLRSWLFSIAHRRCAEHHRRRYRRREFPTERLPERADPAGGADAQMWFRGAASEAVAALDVLDERERHVVTLRVLGDLSVAEVADETGLSNANVRVIQTRALSKLRSHVAHNGGQLDRRFRVLLLPVAADLGRKLRALWSGPAAAAASGTAVSPWLAGVAAVSVATVVGISAATSPDAAISPAGPVPEVSESAAAGDAAPTNREPSTLLAPAPDLGFPTEEAATADGAVAERASEEDAIDEEPPTRPVDVDRAGDGQSVEPEDVLAAIASLPPITPATLADGTVSSALLSLTQRVSEIGERTGAAVAETLNTLTSGVDRTVDGAFGTVEDAAQELSSGVESAVAGVADTTQAVAEGTTEAVRAVADPEPGSSAVESAAEAATSTIESTVTEAGSTVGSAVATIGTTVDSVAEGAASTANGALETVSDTVDEVTDTVDDLIGGLGDLLGG